MHPKNNVCYDKYSPIKELKNLIFRLNLTQEELEYVERCKALAEFNNRNIKQH